MKRSGVFPVAILVFGFVLSACAGIGSVEEDTPVVKYGPQYTPQEHHQRTFDALWEHVQGNYIYSDSAKVDWDTLYDKYSARIGAGLNSDQFTLLMQELAGELPAGAMSHLSRQARIEADLPRVMSQPTRGSEPSSGFKPKRSPTLSSSGSSKAPPPRRPGSNRTTAFTKSTAVPSCSRKGSRWSNGSVDPPAVRFC